ncbi:hypothetical protein B9Z55_020922 [Caenorhabditis nigoni]|uniref:F-box domain-containing protein n=1 Tax=Caenorhabditis nigoni TaxID=1611254 RepID=A0A2G5TPS3_9PELO|nr:hypothetical protein B9Z55_020922 [Caenorhabditis nigoni]
MTTLIDIPDVVLDQVLEFCDFRAIICLRKVCHALRDYIDLAIPDARLPSLELSVLEDSVVVRYGKFGTVQYAKEENGCSLDSGYLAERKLFENQNFMVLFFNDIKFVIKHQKTTLDMCNLRCLAESSLEKFLGELEDVLKSRKTFLKSKEIHIEITDHRNVLSYLPYLDSNSLKNIWIFDTMGREPKELLELRELANLEQWKNAKQIGIPAFFILNNDLGQFLHLRHSLFCLETVTMLNLEFLREKIISSEEIEILDFNYTNFEGNDQSLIEMFGMVSVQDENGKKWYFKKEENHKERKIWEFSHETSENPRFAFRSLKEDQVPEGAVIKVLS